jgi:hypothetical protein
MAKRRYSSEQIIVKLREAEVLESKGKGHCSIGLNYTIHIIPRLFGCKCGNRKA